MGYIMLSEFVVRRLPDKNRPQVRPWLWVGPALFLVAAFLLFPMIGTIVQSFEDNKGSFVGLQNFGDQLGSYPGGSWIAIRNNLIFMPMAISSVALGVIWKFMYWYQPSGEVQTGTLNALVSVFHHDPVAWLQDQWPGDLALLNNLALITAATWGISGFSMVILSAALKGIPGDLLEAARVDGAGETTIFRRVIFPLMRPTIVVVGTTLVIFALKAFDVVYVMTNGLYNSDVLALRMYNLLYLSHNNAAAAAVAIVLLIAVVPVLIFNLRQL